MTPLRPIGIHSAHRLPRSSATCCGAAWTVGAMQTAGDQPAVSDLTWLECRVKSLRLGDAVALADMEAFLTAADVVRVPMPTPVYERARRIRAVHNYKLADALHLATAVEGGCGLFLTNDHRLSGFPDITARE